MKNNITLEGIESIKEKFCIESYFLHIRNKHFDFSSTRYQEFSVQTFKNHKVGESYFIHSKAVLIKNFFFKRTRKGEEVLEFIILSPIQAEKYLLYLNRRKLK